jgi:hypothetical protein
MSPRSRRVRRRPAPTLRPLGAAAAVLAAASLATAPGADAASSKTARVTVTATKPAPVERSRASTVKVRVVNGTRGTVRGLTVSVSRPTGTTVTLEGAKKGRLTRTLPTLRRRAGVTLRLRVTPGSKARTSSTVRIAVRRGGKVAARVSAVVRVKTTTGPDPQVAGNPFVGRLFWRSSFIGTTTYVEGLYFPGPGFAYRGMPKGGLPACTAVTAVGDDDGCVPSTFDPASGALTVNAVPAVPSGPHGLQVGEDSYSEAAIPPAGTLWDLTLQYINAYGICPLSCTTVNIGLKMTAAGAFARSAAISGSTTDTDFAALPPDQHGTYAITDGGRITFTYADGKVETQTIGILFNQAGAADPSYGILLDDSVFFGPSSDVL